MTPPTSVLLTDLYQLTMLQAYFDEGLEETAVFEFYARKLPPTRNFLLAAGLEQVLEYLETLHFTGEELEWLATTGYFHERFLSSLERFRFTGDVHAMPEGTVVFPDEPLIRITAPLPQAQLVESRIINLLHYQTLIASKAARVVLAAQGKGLIDFGMRRAHGAEAGLHAARADYIAGFAGTATVVAGMKFGIPVSGTMAHSFILSHEDEAEAFAAFARSQPHNTTFLIDTYDSEAAAHKLVKLAPELKREGIDIKAVRIDSGDFADICGKVRRILDEGGLTETRILISGDMDEYSVQKLVADGVPIDGFGVGTRLDTSVDVPYLNSVYKLQELGGQPKRKRSKGKETWPGRKQVYRKYTSEGRMAGDMLTLEGDTQEGTPLIRQIMSGGKRLESAELLEKARARAVKQMQSLPDELRSLESAPAYSVELSAALKQLARSADDPNTA